MKISIGNDHAGPEYKFAIIDYLEKEGHHITNHGTDSFDSVDYPDYVHPVAQQVATKEADFGILICGSANGVAMTANKYQEVRAGICWNQEITRLTRQHNNANIICIPARFTAVPQAVALVKTFIHTQFEGGRHQNRVAKIACS